MESTLDVVLHYHSLESFKASPEAEDYTRARGVAVAALFFSQTDSGGREEMNEM